MRFSQGVTFVLWAAFLWVVVGGRAPAARADAAWDEAKQAFRAAQADPDWKKRREAYVSLGDYDRAEAVVEVLGALSKEAFPPVILSGLDTLAAMRSSGARTALLEAAKKGRGHEGLYVLTALAQQEGPEVEAALVQAAKGVNGPVAAQAALALGAQPAAVALPVLLPLLLHKDWQVRRASARALGQLKAKEALLPLATALQLERGRVRADVISALTAITGHDLGHDLAAWKALAGGTPVEQIAKKPAPVPSLFGVPIYGARVVVCFDNSLRMGDPHPFGERDRLRALCTPPDGPPIFFGRMATIQDFARSQVMHWIDGLDAGTRFEIVVYNETVERVLGRLTGAGSGPKKLASDALELLKPDNGIAAYGALSEALDIAGGGESGAWKNGPEEIVFVGASTPNTGELADADAIASAIGLKAGLRQVPVHMVGIHTHPYDMYKLIAERTGGRYVDLTK